MGHFFTAYTNQEFFLDANLIIYPQDPITSLRSIYDCCLCIVKYDTKLLIKFEPPCLSLTW